MFDAMTFVRKNAKSLSTNVKAYGFKMKLQGWGDDTTEGLAELAKQQVEDVKVSLPRVDVDADRSSGKSAVLSPKHTSQLITGKEDTKEKPKKERGGIDPALVETNGHS